MHGGALKGVGGDCLGGLVGQLPGQLPGLRTSCSALQLASLRAMAASSSIWCFSKRVGWCRACRLISSSACTVQGCVLSSVEGCQTLCSVPGPGTCSCWLGNSGWDQGLEDYLCLWSG